MPDFVCVVEPLLKGGGRGVTEAAAEIARTAAQSWLAPLLDTACDRLAFVLGSLVDLAVERSYSGGRGVTEVEELQKQWGLCYWTFPISLVFVLGQDVTACTAAQSWLAPLLDTAYDRLAFVLGSLVDLAVERNHQRDLGYGRKLGDDMFHAALKHSYNRFIEDLAKQCKQLVRHHLDSVTSPYFQICEENASYRFNQALAAPL
ncbi:hypothetical protein U1Q18_029096 [Sarracenia purpurea var. burkii]